MRLRLSNRTMACTLSGHMGGIITWTSSRWMARRPFIETGMLLFFPSNCCAPRERVTLSAFGFFPNLHLNPIPPSGCPQTTDLFFPSRCAQRFRIPPYTIIIWSPTNRSLLLLPTKGFVSVRLESFQTRIHSTPLFCDRLHKQSSSYSSSQQLALGRLRTRP